MHFLHRFSKDISGIKLPDCFNNPFHYKPHPLSLMAAGEVKSLIQSNDSMRDEAAKGKMFGVLVVRDSVGNIGYLAAFSGLLCGKSVQQGFVPPVFDFQNPDGYFKHEEAGISLINREIERLELDVDTSVLIAAIHRNRREMAQEIEKMRTVMKNSKTRRDALRKVGRLSAEDEAALVRESQFQKAELKRLTLAWQQKIEECEAMYAPVKAKIEVLKEERRRRSAALQEWLFDNFVMLNAKGESSSLFDIFKKYRDSAPPSGSGECAAPKLLQCAYSCGLQPICMAEFWLGASPVGEVRREGCFYGSCKGKCEPILAFMLQGLEVEKSSLENAGEKFKDVQILYEDEWIIVVDKPSGMLSVPGIVGGPSLQDWLMKYSGNNELRVVHRLDMSTSGLILAAKDGDTYKMLQAKFAEREIKKCYTAVLDGSIGVSQGEVSLPIAPDYMNRPRQMVDFERGKEAVTLYRQLSTIKYKGRECSVVELQPVTGRTHQLRVHCAYSQGLDCPIVGDELYGSPDERLMLHASYIAFEHPVKKCMVEIKSDGFDFNLLSDK